jgi:hypothetical protein
VAILNGGWLWLVERRE